CQQAAGQNDLQRLHAWHRVGEVPVNEVSLQIVMRSRHREAGLEAMAWLICEIKASVPIWKWGVTSDGRRFPSVHAGHEISEKTG
ncbi:MAG: molybdenum cofactor biosynthesis protein MoaE, partial [Candidatus Marinimicrobia bacterium]|nr:molybdenum cofactor biosynthesis protein MoaE [Candidatus Neomarinimicrobiota bacterium]